MREQKLEGEIERDSCKDYKVCDFLKLVKQERRQKLDTTHETNKDEFVSTVKKAKR